MVTLDQITTGTGDRGTTSLADGTRVAKSHPRVGAYGTIDELNSLLGVVLAEVLPDGVADELRRVQHDLFDLGAELATPGESDISIDDRQVKRLEGAIETVTGELEPAESFILPGGSRAAALIHLARAVARRAEREVAALTAKCDRPASPEEGIPARCLIYLNRLSDLLFVYARLSNDRGRRDVLWIPRRKR